MKTFTQHVTALDYARAAEKADQERRLAEKRKFNAKWLEKVIATNISLYIPEAQLAKIYEEHRDSNREKVLEGTGRFLGIACDICRTELYVIGHTGFTGRIEIGGCAGCGNFYQMSDD